MFSDLPKEVQGRFLEYEFVVVLLSGATDSDVLNIFARLNSYSETLNRQELLNARFFGEFKTFVYDLGREHLEFWRQFGILSDRRIVRMAEADLASELVIAIIDGLQDKKTSIPMFYERFDDEFQQARGVGHKFRVTIDQISDVFDAGLPRAFRNKILFYSLFCVFYDALYGMPHSTVNPEGVKFEIPSANRERVVGRLEFLSSQRYEQEPRPEYVEFIRASQGQTDNINPRQSRHSYIWNEIEPFLKRRSRERG